MLVVRIEKWRYGDPLKARLLGLITIANAGTGGREIGNYVVRLFRWRGVIENARTIEQRVRHPRVSETWRKATVNAFPRLRLGPWDLLLRGLVAAVGARNLDVPEGTELGEPPDANGDDDQF